MKCQVLSLLVLAVAVAVHAEVPTPEMSAQPLTTLQDIENAQVANEGGAPLNRNKRTLLLKKKIIGAGAVGFGLGVGVGAVKG